jgi:dihydroxy-acid dehydratase
VVSVTASSPLVGAARRRAGTRAEPRHAPRGRIRAGRFFAKSQIGVASTWSQVTPCNAHIDQLAIAAAEGVAKAGSKPLIFNTITISDGISMGTQGMKYSLVSREVIADSIETVVGCELFDGLVAIGGCDKNMPGCLIAMARLNRPAVFVYGGTILPGCFQKPRRRHRLRLRGGGRARQGKMSDSDLASLEACAIPGAGSCGGMYTANTMACAIEALGMSLPNSSAQTPFPPRKRRTPATPARRCIACSSSASARSTS